MKFKCLFYALSCLLLLFFRPIKIWGDNTTRADSNLPIILEQPNNASSIHQSSENIIKYLELVGTIVDGHQGKNIALIEDLRTHHQMFYNIGSLMPDGTKVVKILSRKVWLEKKGIIHKLELRHESNVFIGRGYQRLSHNEWKVDGSNLFSGIMDVFQSLNGVEAGNYRRPDGAEGLRLKKIPEDHLLKNLGFEEGDIIENINEDYISDFGDVIDYLWSLEDQDHIVVSVDRQGVKKELKYYTSNDELPAYSRSKIRQVAQNNGLLGVTLEASW